MKKKTERQGPDAAIRRVALNLPRSIKDALRHQVACNSMFRHKAALLLRGALFALVCMICDLVNNDAAQIATIASDIDYHLLDGSFGYQRLLCVLNDCVFG